MSWRGKEDKSQ